MIRRKQLIRGACSSVSANLRFMVHTTKFVSRYAMLALAGSFPFLRRREVYLWVAKLHGEVELNAIDVVLCHS